MIYGYIRVSTDKQTVENQRYEIEQYAKRNGITIDRWVEETVSSTKQLEKRKLGELLKKVKKGDRIIATEISRIGRNLLQVMGILNVCLTVGVQIYTIKDNFTLSSDIQSKVLAFAFGLAAEIERNLISQRTTEALRRIKAEGKILGRPKGRKSSHIKLTGTAEVIKRLLEKGNSRNSIARSLKVHRGTLAKYIVENSIAPKCPYPPQLMRQQKLCNNDGQNE
jgi:DNA invertase Pin-like site-specific DNA recombinase